MGDHEERTLQRAAGGGADLDHLLLKIGTKKVKQKDWDLITAAVVIACDIAIQNPMMASMKLQDKDGNETNYTKFLIAALEAVKNAGA